MVFGRCAQILLIGAILAPASNASSAPRITPSRNPESPPAPRSQGGLSHRVHPANTLPCAAPRPPRAGSGSRSGAGLRLVEEDAIPAAIRPGEPFAFERHRIRRVKARIRRAAASEVPQRSPLYPLAATKIDSISSGRK